MKQCNNVTMKQWNRGLSILGVIIAVFIISAGLVAILSLLNLAISSSQLSKSRITASFLVQEGIEVIRNIRDTNWLQTDEDWNNGIRGTGNESKGIVNYYTQNGFANLNPFPDSWTIDDCINDSTDPCRLYIQNGVYFHDLTGSPTGRPTNFYRLIQIYKVPPGDKTLKIVCEVKWSERNRWHSMQAEERLWNWK